MPTLITSQLDVYIFYREAGRPSYLLLRDSEGTQAGLWRQVSGEVAAGETAAACAVRLVQQTVGQPAVALWALDLARLHYEAGADGLVIAPVFLVEVTGAHVAAQPRLESRWVRYEQALDMLPRSCQREAITRAHEDVGIALDRGQLYRLAI